MKKIYNLLLLSTLLLFGASNAWADWGSFDAVYMVYTFNSVESNFTYYNGDNNSNPVRELGTLTGDFVINKIYLKLRDDWNWNPNAYYTGGHLWYLKNGENQYFNTFSRWNNKGKDGEPQYYEYYNENCALTIASATSNASGKYEFVHNYQVYKSGGHDEINNSGNNYKFTYTILPPAVSGFAVGHSDDDVIAGAGTAESPYVIRYNGSLKLTATGSQAHTDANSSLQANYGDAGYSSTANTISNITSAGSITVQGKYYNSTASLSGAETDEVTVYYTVGYDLSISTHGWASLYLPFKAVVPEDADVFYAKSSDKHETYVTLTAISAGSTIPSGEGFIVKDGQYDGSSAHSYNFVLSDETAVIVSNNILTGTTTSISTPDGAYVLSGATTIDNCIFAPFDGETLGAYKAYIAAGSLSAPTVRFIVDEENNTTNIENVQAIEDGVKFIQNGKLFIKKNGVVYDMMGIIVK